MPKALALSLQTLVAGLAVSILIALSISQLAFRPLFAESTAWEASPAASVGDFPDVAIESSTGTHTTFAATNGHVRVATMFYAHCPGVCPMTFQELRQIEGQLSAVQRARLNFVLLSLDPTHDSPADLRELARQHGMSGPGWLVGRTSEAETGSFAAATGIQYRHLSNGSIDHSSALVLLDEQGHIRARMADSADTANFVAAVHHALDR